MTTIRTLQDAPGFLVDRHNHEVNWGTFTGQVPDANLLDCSGIYGNDKRNDRFLKEWQAFQFSDETRFICGAIYNAKRFGLVALSYYDKSDNTHYVYKKFMRPSKVNVANGRLPSRSQFLSKNIEFSISRNPGKQNLEVHVHWKKQGSLPELKLDVSMDESQSGMSICQPLTKHRPLYSYKNLMPGKVNMSLDNKPVTFSDKGFGIIDDHKGYYPKTVNYDWGTAGTYINNKLTGFNLTRNQVLNPEQFNENCLWLDGKVWALPAITVSHEKHSWHYTDVAGMVDLHFTELVPNSQKFHLGFVYMDYQGPFGLFNGVIHHPEVGAVEFKNVLGMAERKRYKL